MLEGVAPITMVQELVEHLFPHNTQTNGDKKPRGRNTPTTHHRCSSGEPSPVDTPGSVDMEATTRGVC